MFAAVYADVASWHPIRARQRNYRDRFHDNGDTLHARCQVDKIVPRESGFVVCSGLGMLATFCRKTEANYRGPCNVAFSTAKVGNGTRTAYSREILNYCHIES